MEGRKVVRHKLGPSPDMKRRLRVVKLYVNDGLNCSQVAKKVGVSRQAVRQMLIRSNIPIRQTGRPTR